MLLRHVKGAPRAWKHTQPIRFRAGKQKFCGQTQIRLLRKEQVTMLERDSILYDRES